MYKEKLKELIKNKYKWIVFTVVLIIFLAIAEDVFEQEIFVFDGKIYNFLLVHRNNVLNGFFKAITNLGSGMFLIPLVIICMILIKDKKYKIMLPTNMLVSVSLNLILKNIFERPRPDEFRLIEVNGYSFPSGHAMVSTAVYGLLIYIAYKKIENKKIRNIICALLVMIILLIDISRIYVGVHYVSDVIAGTCLSIAYLILFTSVVHAKKKVKIE